MAIKGSYSWKGKQFDDVYGRVERFVFRSKKTVLFSLVLFLDESHKESFGPFDGLSLEFEYDLDDYENLYAQAYKLVKSLPEFASWSDV